VVTRDGPTAIYTGVRRSSKSLVESVCLAHPLDEKLESWRADGNNPVIPGPPSGLDTTGFRDPHVSRIDGAWRLLVGSGIRDRGGMVLEYRSTDLRRWQYRGCSRAAR
jgi:beta-fructofuranosidase